MISKSFLNIFSLFALHGSNALVGLIAAPIALSRLGAEEYSRIAVTEALALFGVTAVIYSFDVLGVKKVVEAEGHRQNLSLLLRDVTATKLCIFLVVALLTFIGYAVFAPDMLIYAIAWLLLPLSYAVQPNWFYLGLEKNLRLAVITLASRILLIVLVLQIISTSSSGVTFILIYGGCFVLSASVSLAFAVKEYTSPSLSVSFRSVKSLIIEGVNVFLAAFSVGLFRGSNVILLAIFGVDSSVISIYAIVEKFVKAVQVACRPLNQFFTPQAFRILANFDRPDLNAARSLVKAVKGQVLLLFGLWIFCFAFIYFSSFGTYLGLRAGSDSVSVLVGVGIMSVATFFGVMNYMYGTISLNAFGYGRFLFSAIAVTGFVTIIVSSVLIQISPFYGAAFGFVFGEALLFSILLFAYLNGGIRA